MRQPDLLRYFRLRQVRLRPCTAEPLHKELESLIVVADHPERMVDAIPAYAESSYDPGHGCRWRGRVGVVPIRFPSPEPLERAADMNKSTSRAVLGVVCLAVLAVCGVVLLRTGTDSKPAAGSQADRSPNPSTHALRFPPPTSHGHTFKSWDGEHPTEVEEKYDEFSDLTTTSVEVRPFTDKFFSLAVTATRKGQSPSTTPESVEILFTAESVWGFPFKSESEMWLLLDGRRLQLSGWQRAESTSPSTEALVASATKIQRMNEHIRTIERDTKEHRVTPRKSSEDFDVPVMRDTDYWVRLSKSVPISDFLDIVNAKSVRGRIGSCEFTVSEEELDVLRDFASRLAPH